MIAYLVCALIWGTTWFAIRVCIGPGGYPTMPAAAIRFGIAALILIPMAWRARPWPTGRAWMWLVIAGVLDAVGYALVYLGEERVPGGLAAVLFGTQPLILALLLTATRLERIGWAEVAGALVSLVGVGIIYVDRHQTSASEGVGVLLVLGSVVASTIYSMIIKRHGDNVHAFASTAVFITVTAICLGAACLVTGDTAIPWPPPAAPTAALLYLAIAGSVVAFATYFWLLSATNLMTTSTLSFVLPLVALLCDALFEHAAFDGRAYTGIAVTLSGLIVSLAWKRLRSTSPGVVEAEPEAT